MRSNALRRPVSPAPLRCHRPLQAWASAIALLALLLPSALGANTYGEMGDYAVVCLDAETGEVLWRAQPPELGDSEIHAGNGRVVAVPWGESVGVEIDAADGAILETGESSPDLAGLSGPLPELPRQLTASDGTVLLAPEDGAMHLEAVEGELAGREGEGAEVEAGEPDAEEASAEDLDTEDLDTEDLQEAVETRVVRHLLTPPHDLHVVGQLAIFSLASQSYSPRAGEVVAYDLQRGVLAWEFEAWRHDPSSTESLTEIAVDGDRVLVTVNEVVYALALMSGEVLWRTELPAQSLRPYDSFWTRFGVLGETLVVASYEDLFLLRRDDGELLWTFDPGPFGSPWPTVAEGRLYVAARDPAATADLDSWTPELDFGPIPSFARVAKGGRDLELVPLGELPADAVTWSELSDVPKAPPGAEEILLEQHTYLDEVLTVDLSALLGEGEVAWVKLGTTTLRVVVRRDGEELASADLTESVGGMSGVGLGVSAAVLVMSLLFLWQSARATKSSASTMRDPGVERVYKTELLRANFAAAAPAVGCALIVFIPATFLAVMFGPLLLLFALPVFFVASLVGNISVSNWTALVGNANLRAAARRSPVMREVPAHAVFVGVSNPAKKSFFNQLVDTHEDIGFLYLSEDRLIFEGIRGRRELRRAQIKGFRDPLVWQFAYLGLRWLAIDSMSLRGPATLLVSSREGATLRANHRATLELRQQVEAWMSGGA